MRLLAFTLVLHMGIAAAQTYPTKPLKLVTPFPPGGSADVIARLAAERLGDGLGQPVVVDNRQGAGGMVGNDYASKQPPDGYTLLLITGAYPVQAAMLKSLPFDPLRDIAMVSVLTSYPFVISVRPDSRFRTLGDLIAEAKANPGKLNYPSSGIGTVHHLSGELLNAMAGIDMTHVPFRGGASPLTEVLGGRVDLLLEAMTLSIGQIQSGKLRALAVTSRERRKALPHVPGRARIDRGDRRVARVSPTPGAGAVHAAHLRRASRHALLPPVPAKGVSRPVAAARRDVAWLQAVARRFRRGDAHEPGGGRARLH